MFTISKLIVAVAATVATSSAFAAGPDLSALTPDTSTIITAIGTVGALLIGVNLAIKGFHVVRSLMGK